MAASIAHGIQLHHCHKWQQSLCPWVPRLPSINMNHFHLIPKPVYVARASDKTDMALTVPLSGWTVRGLMDVETGSLLAACRLYPCVSSIPGLFDRTAGNESHCGPFKANPVMCK